ncbi:cell wall metabolism sensor histidine kinase WalK [Candidatus Sulfidibacterium hydrothermale]|uniref:sensor histidine kinase n=1 Tax=Candidatus Sulfidibacterium hydrothermale TaxID=2875962 RepID=UPI001F0AAD80|nr:ATP-binding protein [Candidatus Sulfidibacterium hydrothermale]UBM62499.1 cell wall metabolism sensor histidine kinase WalK [Candidatus Sulfidibacterium hydrothermale]
MSIKHAPRNVALLNAAVITLTFLSIYGVMVLTGMQLNAGFLFLTAVILFTAAYISVYYSLNRFIYNRLKVIYKTIGKWHGTQRRQQTDNNQDDILGMVNQVVLEWHDEQQQKIDELQKMEAYRREFLGNVSHELKTPIFNIQGYILSLLDGGLKDEKINKKFLKKTAKSVDRMIAIVQDLEEISKFESGVLNLNESVFDINELTREVAEFLEVKAEKNNTEIVIKEPENRKLKVMADKVRIRQVLVNLVDNAINYGKPENGRIVISFYDFHDNILVEVSDNGIGIPEVFLPRIFERFFRVDKSRSREKGGTGLGLAIVKHIIEAHRQSITVRSKPGKGTTFSFTLKKA